MSLTAKEARSKASNYLITQVYTKIESSALCGSFSYEVDITHWPTNDVLALEGALSVQGCYFEHYEQVGMYSYMPHTIYSDGQLLPISKNKMLKIKWD